MFRLWTFEAQRRAGSPNSNEAGSVLLHFLPAPQTSIQQIMKASMPKIDAKTVASVEVFKYGLSSPKVAGLVLLVFASRTTALGVRSVTMVGDLAPGARKTVSAPPSVPEQTARMLRIKIAQSDCMALARCLATSEKLAVRATSKARIKKT